MTGTAELGPDTPLRRPRGVLRVAYFVAYPNSLAGASRSLLVLLTNLPDWVRPVVVCTREGKVEAECRRLGIECQVIAPGPGLMTFGKQALHWSASRRVWVALRDLAPYTLQLIRWLRHNDIDLVHANDPRGALLIGPAATASGVPLVSHLRGRKAYSGAYWQVFERLSKRVITVCDAVASGVSPACRHKTRTVYNAIADCATAPEPFSKAEVVSQWLVQLKRQGVAVVGCVASITPFKGLHHLLDAVAILANESTRPVVFLVIGEAPSGGEAYEAWLLDKMRGLSLDNVTFVGFQSFPMAWYRQLDIAVLPSVESETLMVGETVIRVEGNEGFPRAHLEAASVGLPVVGTRIGGVAELVLDGSTGLLVPPGDAKQLAQALCRLLEDSVLAEQLGAAARARVLKRFTVERCVDGTLQVYREVLPKTQLDWSRT